MRPLGVQVYALAYRSGEPWNETAFSNQEFDDLLAQAYGGNDALAGQLPEMMVTR
jgi:peptide/nickel transport system substrate-binding protein